MVRKIGYCSARFANLTSNLHLVILDITVTIVVQAVTVRQPS